MDQEPSPKRYLQMSSAEAIPTLMGVREMIRLLLSEANEEVIGAETGRFVTGVLGAAATQAPDALVARLSLLVQAMASYVAMAIAEAAQDDQERLDLAERAFDRLRAALLDDD